MTEARITMIRASEQGEAAPPDARQASPTDPDRRPGTWLLGATTGLGLRLGLASALVVSLLIGGGALFAYHGEKEQLLRAMREAASTQGRLVLTGLKSAMLQNNRTLLTDLFEEYARSSEVERIYLVDATGAISFASEPPWPHGAVSLPADLCPTCQLPDDVSQTRATVVEEGGRPVLRSLTMIPNEPRCHRCHPADQTLLGGLGVDFSMASLEQAWAAMIARTLQWGTAVCVLVLLAVGAVVQLGALRRVRRLRDATRSLSGPTGVASRSRGRDEIRELAENIQTVSFSLQQSMAEVGQQRQFLVDLIDRMDDGVAVFDRSLQVVAANKSYLERVRGSGREFAPAPPSCASEQLCLHAEIPADCPTRRAFLSGRLEQALHTRQAGAREVYYEVFASPMTGESGEVEHVVEVWRDVTTRVTMDANLARSEQLATVGVLASGFSHEISTPLGTIATTIQGLLRRLRGCDRLEAGDVDTLRARLELASREVFRCRDITRSLLNLSRADRTAPARVDIGGVLTRMLDVVRPTAERQRVRIECSVAPDRPLLLGHVSQLEQLMLNLFVNAIEAMPDGGTLAVSLAVPNGAIEILVADTGVGVPSQDRTRIFEPFFSRKTGGTGLGLYVSRQVVETHRGQIEVASSDQSGTRLRVILPCQAQPRDPATGEREDG